MIKINFLPNLTRRDLLDEQGRNTYIKEDTDGVPAADGVSIFSQVLCECLGISLQANCPKSAWICEAKRLSMKFLVV